jgi:hypothetical protein
MSRLYNTSSSKSADLQPLPVAWSRRHVPHVLPGSQSHGHQCSCVTLGVTIMHSASDRTATCPSRWWLREQQDFWSYNLCRWQVAHESLFFLAALFAFHVADTLSQWQRAIDVVRHQIGGVCFSEQGTCSPGDRNYEATKLGVRAC